MQKESIHLPRELNRWVDKPYGGLFGSSVIAKVVQEIVADPESEYRIRDISKLLNVSSTSVKNALKNLEELNLVFRKNRDLQRPIYIVNESSRTFTALNFLTYALDDDRDGTEFMNEEVLNYCDYLSQIAGQELVIVKFQGYNYVRNTNDLDNSIKIDNIYPGEEEKSIHIERGIA